MKQFLCLTVILGLATSSLTAQKAPSLAEDTLPASLQLVLPEAIAAVRQVPAESPLTKNVVALGRKLFFDPILSKDKAVSCASCHRPESGFASPDPVAIGISGKKGTRNTPTLFNRVFGGPSFWDGRADTLEEQVLEPISNPVELGHTLEGALAALRGSADYKALFARAFKTSPDSAIDKDKLARALATFVRSLVLADSPVDQFHRGDSKMLNTIEKRGLWIFESKGGCWQCHTGFNFTDEEFHNTGVSWKQEVKDPGRGEITKNESDLRGFKTPTLRGLVPTAPYMHDGSVATLEGVVEFYNKGGSPEDKKLDRRLRPLDLDENDKAALVAFLRALSRNAVDTSRPASKSAKSRDNLSGSKKGK